MKLRNTLTNLEEEFSPIEQNKVRMFVCGPTVYNYIHIGNARTFVIFDMFGRYLEYLGFELNYVQNITDIDDRIIHAAHESGKKPEEVAETFKKIFIEDVGNLKITSVNNYAPASEHIEEIKNQVKTLIEKGYAYAAPAVRAEGPDSVDTSDNQDVYFDITKYEQDFPGQYGQLSRQDKESLETGVRVAMESNKRSPRDFVLWKAKNYSYDPSWESPWGHGRPGWHIEDTAISEKYLGQQYDIHGGAHDLIFPHHEAEIAQQQAASGKVPFVKYWVHAGFLVNKNEKMSKSLGNFAVLRELLAQYKAETLRLFLLSGHYHAPLSFEDKALKQADAAITRIGDFLAKLEKVSGEQHPEIDNLISAADEQFITAMDDDFNTPKALAALFDFIRAVNPLLLNNQVSETQAGTIKAFLGKIERILGIIPPPEDFKNEERNGVQIQSSVFAGIVITDEIKDLAVESEKERQNKNYEKSDEIRNKIKIKGFNIKNTDRGRIIISPSPSPSSESEE